MSNIASSWSRRRAAVAAEAKAEVRAAEEALHEKEQAALCDKPDEEILESLGLPDPDSLVCGDDFKAFLSKAVPAHLRKRALRKLWVSNPVLACVDGLNDYDDDYLTGSFGQEPIKTTYQVGKGMLAHLLEIDRQKESAAAPLAVEVEAAEIDEIDEQKDCNAPVEVAREAEAAPEHPEQNDVLAPSPRRMQFQFQGDVA